MLNSRAGSEDGVQIGLVPKLVNKSPACLPATSRSANVTSIGVVAISEIGLDIRLKPSEDYNENVALSTRLNFLFRSC